MSARAVTPGFSRWCRALALAAAAGCGGTVMHFGDTAGDTGVATTGGMESDAGGDGRGGILGGTTGGPTTTTTTGTGGVCHSNVGASTPLTLTNLQYDNAVKALFGYAGSASKDFDFPPNQPWNGGFLIEPAAPISQVRLAHYLVAAQGVAAAAVQHLETLLTCDRALGDDACADLFIDIAGPSTYRRALTSEEKVSLRRAYDDARATGSLASGIEAVIVRLLMSPQFYLLEQPRPAGSVSPLSPDEIASRLSFFLLQSVPDGWLRGAAATGTLSTAEGIESTVRGLLTQPTGRTGVRQFFSQWLELDTLDGSIEKSDIPEFAGIRSFMRDETAMFTESVFFDGGPWTGLLLSRRTFLNEVLAGIYEQPGIVGTTLVPTMVDASRRSGLLTQPSFLSINSHNASSPTLRGKFVRSQLLCSEIPPPPQSVKMDVPEDPMLTTRQQYEAHRTNPACVSCHDYMDPIGLGFENYDAIGRFRTTERSFPVDARGEVKNVGSALAGPFTGAIELSSKLAASPEVQSCLATQWFRFALARAESDEDRCSLEAVTAVAQRNGSLVDIVVALVTSDSFRSARW